MAVTQYQPSWIDGRAVGRHQRESESRYDAVGSVLSSYRRSFSVFDLGANAGYFSFRAAEDFPDSTVIAADDKLVLRNLAKHNGRGNVVVIPQRLDGAMLRRIAACERFDVVLALNVLHHIADWPDALEALKEMAHFLIVETPGRGDENAAHPARHDGIRSALVGAKEIARFASHTTPGAKRHMLLVEGDRETTLSAQTIDAAERKPPAMSPHIIRRDAASADVAFARGESRPFVPGMNLWNFALLKGCWPEDIERRIDRELSRLGNRWMDDLRPWNFILTGNRVHAIDVGNKKWRKEPEPGGREKCLRLIRPAKWGETGIDAA